MLPIDFILIYNVSVHVDELVELLRCFSQLFLIISSKLKSLSHDGNGIRSSIIDPIKLLDQP